MPWPQRLTMPFLCSAARAASARRRVFWVATLPPRVNINRLEMMPVFQSFAGLSIHREPPK